ncbi:MAG: hypothetical protein IPK16_31025 [Anaerolineales bacterium]|nr:hypothetical protein [Anaerolineales bacterium]
MVSTLEIARQIAAFEEVIHLRSPPAPQFLVEVTCIDNADLLHPPHRQTPRRRGCPQADLYLFDVNEIYTWDPPAADAGQR